jgi:hypothetical protein
MVIAYKRPNQLDKDGSAFDVLGEIWRASAPGCSTRTWFATRK